MKMQTVFDTEKLDFCVNCSFRTRIEYKFEALLLIYLFSA